MTAHADFELLCALAVSGDLSITERAALGHHLEVCTSCEKKLLEMRRLRAQLVFAQAMKGPSKRLPRGMRERFHSRAMREGIPLSSGTQGVGASALGMVTALLMVLLLVAATLKAGPFRRFASRTEIARGTMVLRRPNLPARRQATNYVHAQIRIARPLVRTHRPAASIATAASAPAVRQFHFTLLAQNSAAIAYPFSTAAPLPDIVPSLSYPDRKPSLTLDVTSRVFRHIVPPLIAYGATEAYSIPSNFDLDPPTGQNFRVLKVDFTANGYRTTQFYGDGSQ